MPLDRDALQSSIEGIAVNPPATAQECANAWASAVTGYAQGIVPPSLAVSSAEAALASGLALAFASPAAAPGMESAFAAWSATVAAGMAPAFIGVPPPVPVGFAAQFLLHPSTHAAAALAIATLIHTWAIKGTSTPALGGSPVAWS